MELDHDSLIISSYLAGFFGGEILVIPLIVVIKLQETNYVLCMIAALLGQLSVDWAVFMTFRKYGHTLLNKFPKIKLKLEELEDRLEHNRFNLLYVYRFIIGLVLWSVVSMGLSPLKVRRFAIYSLVSNVMFILIIGTLGYFFTELMLDHLEFIKKYKYYMILIALGALYLWQRK